MKFGCDVLTEAPHLLKVAQSLGLHVVGVSFHVGSGCGDPTAFYRAISAAKTVFDIGTTLGYNFDLLDIGGGYPGDKGTSIDKVSEYWIFKRNGGEFKCLGPINAILCFMNAEFHSTI
jgi:ornithine decarboxylase